MLSIQFFDIFSQFWFSKIVNESSVHVLQWFLYNVIFGPTPYTHLSWLRNMWIVPNQKQIKLCTIFFSFSPQQRDTVEIAEQLASIPTKSDMPKILSNSSSMKKRAEVEVEEILDDENVRQSPIGAETSDEELHANLDEADDWEPWEDEELCASPTSNQFDEIFPYFFLLYFRNRTYFSVSNDVLFELRITVYPDNF